MSLFRRLRAITNRRRVLGVIRCDEEVRAGPYVLCLNVQPAGTSGAARIGRLYLDGREMVADPGDVVEVDTADGTVCFTFLGEDSGWTADA